MVDTDQISTSADEPGLVIRNEDVFIAKVRERVALAEARRAPALAGAAAADRRAARAARRRCAGARATAAGAPAATDVDQAGRTHAIWLLGPGRARTSCSRWPAAASWSSPTATTAAWPRRLGGLPRFLAVITTPASVAIQPYNRLVSELTTTPARAARPAARAAGARIEPIDGPPGVPAAGGHRAALPRPARRTRSPCPPAPAARVENLDHALVERVLLRDALGLDPGDKRITYVGGDYPACWLAGEVDAGRAELAILIAPVTVDDFVAVNLARQKMPRKSTWFTPKARGGLVLAELSRHRHARSTTPSCSDGLTHCPVCASTWDPITPATN